MGGRGRPRDPSIEERVIAAATRELAERGFQAFSMRSVARLARVARPSLMLRWPTRDALILDTLERLSAWPSPEPSEAVRTQIDTIIAHVAALMEPEMLSIQLRLVADAEKHPELYAAFQSTVIAKAGARLTKLLERAVDEGELRSDTDTHWFADALIGVVFMQTIRSAGLNPPTPAAQRKLVDSMWSALRR